MRSTIRVPSVRMLAVAALLGVGHTSLPAWADQAVQPPQLPAAERAGTSAVVAEALLPATIETIAVPTPPAPPADGHVLGAAAAGLTDF
jgi:hypothetical protein